MKRKKILLLSDDMRMHSGIARMSREIVQGTLHKYDWAQIGGAINHPEKGKRITIQSDSFFTLPDNSSITIYPVDGYGDANMLREVIRIEKPDAILHFTDPRFWVWLYNMEHEIRQDIPIMYYNIWDDLPDPLYNRDFYRSSDLLMSISKQTYGINKRILSKYDYKDWQLQYVPHGISEKWFFKIDKDDVGFKRFENDLGFDKYKFKILYCNRNIRRKNPGDVALAYKHFMDGLTEEQRKECCLVFHSAPSDENGTDMKAVCSTLLPDYPVIWTYDKGMNFQDVQMNYLYNSCDVYVNMASNEGFGLGSAESIMTETPIIVNVTGGLQDQCGFKKEDGTYLTAEDYTGQWGSNNDGKYQEHGEWVKPVFPSNISLQGSPQTPYIFDDRCRWDDVGDALRYWYDKGPEGRAEAGKKGSEFLKSKEIKMTAKMMSDGFDKAMSTTLEKWKPQPRYTMEVV